MIIDKERHTDYRCAWELDSRWEWESHEWESHGIPIGMGQKIFKVMGVGMGMFKSNVDGNGNDPNSHGNPIPMDNFRFI